jgi:hemoglobin-like flavoprotein
MTPDQVALVQSSFSQLAHDPDGVARAFYARLFALDPSLRLLFGGDMARQRGKLMRMLGTAVSGLGDVHTLLPVLRELGARHVHYGVHDPHYAAVGEALLLTLRAGLGERFSPQVEEAWAAAFAIVSDTMKAGARAARAAHA